MMLVKSLAWVGGSGQTTIFILQGVILYTLYCQMYRDARPMNFNGIPVTVRRAQN